MKDDNKNADNCKKPKLNPVKKISSDEKLACKNLEETKHIPFVDDKLIGDDFLLINALIEDKKTLTDKGTNQNNY